MEPYFEGRHSASQSRDLKPPRSPHGQRLLISHIDRIAKEDPQRKWIYHPKDDNDLTQGFKSVSFRRFARAVHVAAIWLRDHLNLPFRGFPTFAYAGPNDYRYAIFAVAAGKLGFQMLLPDPTITPTGQVKVLQQKKCKVYLCTPETAPRVERVKGLEPSLRVIQVPELGRIMEKSPAESLRFMKPWEDARNDPWLVFHTSGSGTLPPQTITYTHHMMASYDIALGLEGVGDTQVLQLPNTKIYMPIPPMHYLAMNLMLGGTVFARAIPVLGPVNSQPMPALVTEILQSTRLGGAILVPAVLDTLCQDPKSLGLLHKLKFIQYGGASLSKKTGELLSPHSRIAPIIGNADTGGYFCSFPNRGGDWDYVTFHPHAGATMVPRGNGRHELVFIRNPMCCMQNVFHAFPHLQQFETKAMWIEHPTRKGQWRLMETYEDIERAQGTTATFANSLGAILEEPSPILSATLGGQPLPKCVTPYAPTEYASRSLMARGRSSTVRSVLISEHSLTEESSQQSETRSIRNSSPVSERSSISAMTPISDFPMRSEESELLQRLPTIERFPALERPIMIERTATVVRSSPIERSLAVNNSLSSHRITVIESPVKSEQPQTNDISYENEVMLRSDLSQTQNPQSNVMILPSTRDLANTTTLPTPATAERRWSINVPARKAIPGRKAPPQNTRASYTMEVPIIMGSQQPIPSPRHAPSTVERPLTWESETTLNDDLQSQPHLDKMQEHGNGDIAVDPRLIVFKMSNSSNPRAKRHNTSGAPPRKEGLYRYDSIIDEAYRRELS